MAEASKAKAMELSAKRDVLRDNLEDARRAHVKAQTRKDGTSERLAETTEALERLPSTDENELSESAAKAKQDSEAAEAHLQHARSTAPDMEAVEAALKRAQSIEEEAQLRIAQLRPFIAGLDERISGNSGDAVEERLQETEEKLEIARDRLSRIEREVAVLQHLASVLEDARSEARDRYFEPIAEELRPLLHLLWPDAELDWADNTLLPEALTRDGQQEAIDVLSGGTQEQIALLVRLAFARLLAKDGRHAPVLLDDALVFTDDDRIERMFDALHRQAKDLQVIVLSCRQRAFRELGGKSLQIEEAGQVG